MQRKLYNSASPDGALIKTILTFKSLHYIESGESKTNLFNEHTPVLEDGPTATVAGLWTTLYYLDERYPEPPLLPGDPQTRAQIRLLTDQIVINRSQPQGKLFNNLQQILSQQPFLYGSKPSLPDLALFAWSPNTQDHAWQPFIQRVKNSIAVNAA